MTTTEMAKKNFDRGLWTKEMIKKLVVANKLTQVDYKAITGETYQ